MSSQDQGGGDEELSELKALLQVSTYTEGKCVMIFWKGWCNHYMCTRHFPRVYT